MALAQRHDFPARAPWTASREVDRRIRAEILDAPAPPRHGDGLHVCPECAGAFVVPGEICEVVAEHWCRIELSCEACGWHETALHSDEELDELDRELDRAHCDLMWALEVLWIANEEERIGRFARALDAGHLLPEDF